MARNRKKKPQSPPSRPAAPSGVQPGLDTARAFDWRNRTDLVDLGIVIGVALALRMVFFYLNRKYNPMFTFPVMDSLYHHEWARDIAAGGTRGTDAFFRGPLYPYFLALIYKLTDTSIAAAVFIQHLIGALTAGLIYLTARELFSRSVSLVAGLTTALYWVLVYMEGDLQLETTFIFLNTASMLFLLMAMKRHRLWMFAAGGLLLGLATIDRPSIMVFFPVVPLAIYLAARRRPAATRGWVARTLVVAAACAIPIMPVMIRNYVVARAIVPIGASGGVNFYIGNNPASDGSTAIVPGTRADWWGGYNDAIAIAERAEGHKLTLAEVSHYYFKRGWEYIQKHPGDDLALMAKKFRMFWGASERANEKYIYFFWNLARMSRIPLPGFWLVAPLGILGGVLLWRRRSELAMFYLFIALYSIGVIVFFVNARFRLPIMPVMTLFSGYATVYLVHAFRKKRFALVKSLAILAAAALLVNSDFAYRKQMKTYSQAVSNYMLGNAYMQMGMKSAALDHYEHAEEICRAFPEQTRAFSRDVDYNVGTLLWEQGLCSRAIDALERVQGNDDYATRALDCLGDCYLKRRDVSNATRVYEQLSRIAPTDPRGLTGLARCAAMTGDLAKAEDMLKSIIDPGGAVYPPAYIALAEIQRDSGKIDDAIQSYANIAQISGYERDGYLGLVEMYRRKGDIDNAIAALNKAAAYSLPNDPTIQGLFASLRAPR